MSGFAKPSSPDFITRLLQFLSSASNETLGACLVGLIASTYIVLGRIGLLLIGAATGIVLHATWENNHQLGAGEEFSVTELKRKREVGLDVVHRVLDWQEKRTSGQEDGELDHLSPAGLDFADFQPATGAALSALVDAIIRDYVKYRLTIACICS